MTEENLYKIRVHGNQRFTIDTAEYTVAFDRKLTPEQVHALRDTLLSFRDKNSKHRWKVKDGLFHALAQFEKTQGVRGELRSNPVVDVIEIF